jgi:hypothetical protein
VQLYTLYGHLDAVVKGLTVDQQVEAGQPIARMGNSHQEFLRRCRQDLQRECPQPRSETVPTGVLIQRDLGGFGPHIHFEVKNSGALGSQTDHGGPYWGYTESPEPNLAYHPDRQGYHDPTLRFHETATIPEIPVAVTDVGQGASIRLGPGDYRALRTTLAGEQFIAFSTSLATVVPECSDGWYEIRPADGTYFQDPGDEEVPQAWACRGNAGENWLQSPNEPPEPDLTTSLTAMGNYATGQANVPIPVTVSRTSGSLTLGTFVTARLYWSIDATWDPTNDTQLWESDGSPPDYPNTTLNTAGTKTVTPNITIPVVPAGAYYLLAVVDPTNFHPESDETNNVAAYSVTVTAGPTIVLNPSSVSFAATQGGGDPAPQNVSITNGGGGTLNGLEAGAILYGAGQPVDWLAASVTTRTAPSTLHLQVTVGSLTPSTYNARVPVTSAVTGNNPQEVSVTLTVAPPQSLVIAGGTFVDHDAGLISTSFVFNPVHQLGTITSVTIRGPQGWNTGNPYECPRFQTTGAAPTRSLCSATNAPASTGEYTAEATVNGQAVSGRFSINASATLAPPEITDVSVSGGTVMIQWTAASEARSFLVRVTPAPVASTVTAETVVAGDARTATFTGLTLAPGASYEASVFALSQDVKTPGPIQGPFNAGVHRVLFTASGDANLTGTWIGEVTVSLDPGNVIQATLELVQTGTSVSGTYSAANGRTGDVTGSVSGTQFTSTMTFTDICPGSASSTGEVMNNGTRLTGHSTVDDCVGSYSSDFTYDKQ